MRMSRAILAFALAGAGCLAARLAAPGMAAAKQIKVLVVTGGHGFQQKEFLDVFEGHPDIAVTHLDQKQGGEFVDNIAAWPYRVIVLYNHNQKMTEEQRANFLKLMDKGVGLVVLHHASALYTDWPEWQKISGIVYHLGPWEENGVKMPASTYKDGVHMTVHVADPRHPITRGIKDFEITDENYKGMSFDPKAHVLLTTDSPTNDKVLAFTKTYRKSRVVFLQLGHDQQAYTDANYRTLVAQAIRWAAGDR